MCVYVCVCACERGYYVQIAVICYTFNLFYFQLRSISLHMEEEDKHDVHSEVFSHEDSQPTESDINQDSVLYTASSTFPVPANNQTHCSDDYKIVPDIKCEHKPPENMHEYNADIKKNRSVDDDIGYGLQRVKCEEQPQQFNEQQAVIPSRNADQASMLSCGVNADPDEYCRNSDEPRHWVVCQGGVLKQVKAEYTLGVSLLPAEDSNVNVDKTQPNCSKSRANMEHGSQLKADGNNRTVVKHFSSDTSSKSIVKSDVLKVHGTTRTGVKSYTCGTCGKSFSLSGTLKDHEKTHTGLKPYTCDTCGKAFAQSRTLTDHERTHTCVKPYTCDTCGKSFAQSGALIRHERKHTGVRPYTCDICGKSFAQSCNLKNHERTHTGLKPYSCDTCGKSFSLFGNLKHHDRTHTGVKPYACETCGKSFAQSSTLNEHERTHTGVKPYSCDTCGKSFTQSSTLNEHERTHTGVKPYTCDTCGKSFAQSRKLTYHQRTHTDV